MKEIDASIRLDWILTVAAAFTIARTATQKAYCRSEAFGIPMLLALQAWTRLLEELNGFSPEALSGSEE